MKWKKEFTYLNKYKYVSTNQHGDRFRRDGQKRVSVAVLRADWDDETDLRQLILLSHYLGVPVHYDFTTEPQTAYIEIVAKESL